MSQERWRRGESRDRLLQAALVAVAEVGPGGVSGRKVAREAGVYHPQIQQMFGSVDELVASAVLAERDRFAAAAFGDAGLPSPLLAAEFPTMWRAVTQVLLDPGPVGLRRLADGGPVELLAGRLRGREPDRSPVATAAIANAWFAAPLGALIFRKPLQRGLGIAPEDWDSCWERLGERILRLADDVELPIVVFQPAVRSSPPSEEGGRGRERLLRAAEELLATRAETTVTGRELADVAGVNYGLVNHYFGSKGAVFDAALSNLHRYFLDDVLDLGGTSASGGSFAAFAHHRAFLRAWASRLIRGAATPEFELLGMERLMDQVIRARAITTRRSADGLAAAGDAMASVALQLGWSILRPLPAAGNASSLASIEGGLASIHRWVLD